MINNPIISNSSIDDIDTIFELYNIASNYQRAKKEVVVWPEFERTLIETEIAENRQWKMIIDNEIACVWAITFEDKQIWQERHSYDAIYIHRIATNPAYRGNHFVHKIVAWAKIYAKEQGKRYIRLDTLGNNTRLINYYQNAGLEFLGMFDLNNTDGLPDHYKTAAACLFEIDLIQNS